MRRWAPLVLLLAACAEPVDGPLVRVTIPPGATFGAVTDTLVTRGVVRHRLWFKLLGRIGHKDRAVRAGVYEFRPNESPNRVLADLAAGNALQTKLTIPEGLTLYDVAEIAADKLGVPSDSLVAAAQDSLAADSLGLGTRSFEGFLRPDTYLVAAGIGARELTRVMAESFLAAWRPEWDKQLDSLRLTRPQLVTLASIVEGEARVDDERAVIAGVYLNRLRIGMALQADPTVQYALSLKTGNRKPRLYEKDYLIASPYNTYLHPGLPPGPVSSPGMESIVASLYPRDVPYFFFVARPNGQHVFSRTYREHLRAISAVRREERAMAAPHP